MVVDDGCLPQTAAHTNAAIRARRRAPLQMLALRRASALLVVSSSCLWACLWNCVLLQPTRAGAFLLGASGPALLSPSSDAAAAAASYATRPQQLHSCHWTRRRRRRRRRTRGDRGGESSLSMNLRMTPSQPHPTKVAFQVHTYLVPQQQ